MMGFEPTTPGTTIQCSNQLSYNHHNDFEVANIVFNFLVMQQRNCVFNAFFSFSDDVALNDDLMKKALLIKD
jgi:hypothetical protein